MSIAAAQSDAFVREVLTSGAVWAIRDSGGFATATNASGERVMPFRSAESRAQGIIEGVGAYRGFTPIRLELATFVERWLPGLKRDGLLAGVNWSGERATGYDMAPAALRERLAAQG